MVIVNAFKQSIARRVSMKFNLVVALLLIVLMGAATCFIIITESNVSERTMANLGTNLAHLVSKASIDPLLFKDKLALDELMENAKHTEGLLYALVTDSDGVPFTTPQASLNSHDPLVKSILKQHNEDNPLVYINEVKNAADILEVVQTISIDGSDLGKVILGLSRKKAREHLKETTLFFILTSAAIITVLLLAINWMFRVIVAKPLSRAYEAASRISRGDLSVDLQAGSVDEVGNLVHSLNSMTLNLRKVVDKIRSAASSAFQTSDLMKASSDTMLLGAKNQSESTTNILESIKQMDASLKGIGSSTENLKEVNETMSSAILEMTASSKDVDAQVDILNEFVVKSDSFVNEMSSGIQQISKSIQLLSRSSSQVSSSTREINASIENVEKLAHESSALSEVIIQQASEAGLKSIKETRVGMNNIQEAVGKTAEVLNKLSTKVENIGSVLNVINDVTEQTSLLALNASILAAQAGEHGKGFDVVAREIRDLADRTAVSTKEIDSLLSAIHKGVQDVVSNMDEGIGSVEAGVGLVKKSDSALRNIISQVSSSITMSKNIEKSAIEQVAGIAQVAEAIERINEMIQNIAAATSQHKTISEALREVTNKVNHVSQIVKKAMDEQVKSGQGLSKQVTIVQDKIFSISEATRMEQSHSEEIVSHMGQIGAVSQQNMAMAEEQSSAVEKLHLEAEALNSEVSIFSL